MQNHWLALTTPSTCVTVHTGCPTGRPRVLQILRSVSAGLTRIGKRWWVSRRLRTLNVEERFLMAGVTYSSFQTPPAAARARAGARRRRPGSRRSTSAWTAYVGAAAPAAGQDFPEPAVAGSAQWLSSSLPGGRRLASSGIPTGVAAVTQQAPPALPGRRGLKSSAGGPHGLGACPGTCAAAVRGCPPSPARAPHLLGPARATNLIGSAA